MILLIILLPLAIGFEQFPEQDEKQRAVIVNDVSEETQEEILDAINYHRSNVEPTASNMLRMTWSKEAAKTAKNWAGTCIGQSSPEKRYVNGFYCYESTLDSKHFKSWKQVILTWYTNFTEQRYTFGAPFLKKGYLSSHFQLLFYNTYQVGCAEAFCPGNRDPFFYICHFCPAGYIPKQILMPYKKGPPCGDCPNNCMDNLCTNPCEYLDYAWDCEQLNTQFNCEEDIMVKSCRATCTCHTEIV